MSSQNMSSHHRLYISDIKPLDSTYFMHLLEHTVSENPRPNISSLENKFWISSGDQSCPKSGQQTICTQQWGLHWLRAPTAISRVPSSDNTYHPSQGMTWGFQFMQWFARRWKKRAKYYFQYSPTKSTALPRALEMPESWYPIEDTVSLTAARTQKLVQFQVTCCWLYDAWFICLRILTEL